ncbi:MAG: MATE family efflux transporter [Flavobacteriaceae bacterium]|nr:MATE family efflux transporter [Flavobacteriaceae bacterium]
MNLQQYTKEFKYNLSLSFPVILGLLGHTIVQLVDNIMVGQLGTTELAAISLGNSFVFIAMSLGIGFSTAITPLVAQADGRKDRAAAQDVLSHGVVLCMILGVSLFIAVFSARKLMYSMGQPPAVVEYAFPYLKWVAASLVPLIIFQAYKQFADGLSKTRPAMYATVFSNILNVIINYFLIFGYGGFPKMGVEGAAIGTLIARIGAVIYILLFIQYHSLFKGYSLRIGFKKQRISLFKKILSLGFPSALQMFFEVAFFTMAIWMSGILGKNSQAANQIALNLSSMTFMFAMGLGVVAMIRVGNQFGMKTYADLRRIAISLFLLIGLFDVLFCIIYLSFNDQLPWIYLENYGAATPSDTLEVVGIAAGLLLVSGFFQITDGLQAVILGALRGIQDVNIPTTLTFISYMVIGLPVSYYLGLKTSLGAVGIWLGLLTGLSTSALLLFLRFQHQTKKLLN